MLNAAFVVLAIAVVFGSILAVPYLRDSAAAPLPVGVLHGLIGIGSLAILTFALRGPPRGVEEGAGSFGLIAAILLALAASAGLLQLALRLRKRRLPSPLVGLHAMLAIAGFVVLLVYVLAA